MNGLLYDDENDLPTTLLNALEDGRRESLAAAARTSALDNADIRSRADVITDLAAAHV